jgi:hypothetical protein
VKSIQISGIYFDPEVMDFNSDGLPDIASFDPANYQAVGVYIDCRKPKNKLYL